MRLLGCTVWPIKSTRKTGEYIRLDAYTKYTHTNARTAQIYLLRILFNGWRWQQQRKYQKLRIKYFVFLECVHVCGVRSYYKTSGMSDQTQTMCWWWWWRWKECDFRFRFFDSIRLFLWILKKWSYCVVCVFENNSHHMTLCIHKQSSHTRECCLNRKSPQRDYIQTSLLWQQKRARAHREYTQQTNKTAETMMMMLMHYFD